MRIRPAEVEDAEAVFGLLDELGRPPVSDAERRACSELWERQVADPQASHLVAESGNGQLVGFLSMHFRERLNHTTREAWIPDLIVTAAAQGAGIGRALLDEAEERARAAGCHALVLESGYRRAEAHHLYQRAGLRDTGKAFGKRLAQGGASGHRRDQG